MRSLSLALLALLAASATPAPAAEFFFKDGDTVVMIGDSITEQHLYSNYVEMWAVTRFPKWKLTFRNTGIGGDTSPGGNGRFKRDVLSYHPTAMTVDFGMNDGGYQPFEKNRYGNYMRGLQGMADQAKAAGIRAAWVTPQPLDTGDAGPTALTGYNQTLERYSEGVKEIAEKNGGLFVDQFHPYLAVLDKARAASPKYDRVTGGDPVHPGPAGQSLMAASILRGLHFPALVSSAEIDAAGAPQAKGSKHCTVTDLASKDGGVSFQRLDDALPFFPPEAVGILKSAPLLDDMNHYGLKVTGLAKGTYAVVLGGQKVAEYDADQLAEGVNLAAAALKAGPVADQVKAVKTAVERKNAYHHDQIFRGIVLMNISVPDWLGLKFINAKEVEEKRQGAIKARLAKLPELDDAVRAALVMKAHTVEVIPVKK